MYKKLFRINRTTEMAIAINGYSKFIRINDVQMRELDIRIDKMNNSIFSKRFRFRAEKHVLSEIEVHFYIVCEDKDGN